jgi:sugar phosphate isomerase/epimerase
MVGQPAVQLYTLRDYTKTAREFDNVLGLIHEIGYPAVQLSAVGCMSGDQPEVDAKQARDMLDSHGLQCCATHRSWDALRDNTDFEIDFHRQLGCNYVAIGGLWPKDYSQFRTWLQEAAPVIARLRDAGILFGYHNHSHEFVRDPESDATWYDFLIEEGDEVGLMMEVDTYWVAHAGADPVEILDRCAGRIPVIHVKDKEVTVEDGPVFAPVGEGNLNWPAILRAAEEGGTEWYVVEQDTCRRDPFECLRSSYEFLLEALEPEAG